MPLYTFLTNCGCTTTHFRKIAERDEPLNCDCGCGQAKRILEAPALRPEIQEYLSPVTGKPITSRAQRIEDLKRTGSLEWDPGIRADCERRQAESLESTFRSVEAGIDKTVAEMHASNLI